MCDFSGKLMAWHDGELSAGDAAEVERHLQICEQCRGQVEAYRQLSGAFDGYCDAYCEAVTATRSRRKLSRRGLTVAGAAAAVVAALFLLAPRARLQLLPARVPAPETMAALPTQPTPPAQTAQTATTPIKPVSRIERSEGRKQIGGVAPQPQDQDSNGLPAEPAVEIAIPADAIFPPGAVPEGVSFTADVTIAPDGSAQQIRLRPQLTEFERRSTRP
jgi:anti-sigma factor RsiW